MFLQGIQIVRQGLIRRLQVHDDAGESLGQRIMDIARQPLAFFQNPRAVPLPPPAGASLAISCRRCTLANNGRYPRAEESAQRREEERPDDGFASENVAPASAAAVNDRPRQNQDGNAPQRGVDGENQANRPKRGSNRQHRLTSANQRTMRPR